MRKIPFIIILIIIPWALLQSQGLSSFEMNYHFGKMIKHTERITFNPPAATHALDAKLIFQTNGSKVWHHAHGLPEYGINLIHFDLGDKELLGRATGLFPFFNFKIIDQRQFSWMFTFGSGVAYFNNPFNALENPLNNAIGSNINNITALRTSLRLRVLDQITLNLGGAFTHFSNGISKSPNLGFNVASAYLGINYQFNPYQDRIVENKKLKELDVPNFKYELSIGFASKEVGRPGGPNYLVKLANLGMAYRISTVNQFLLELAYEYHTATYHFGLQVYAFENKKEARQGATRYALVIGDEFLFGRIAVNGKVGFYLSSKSYDLPKKYYAKIGARYSIPIFKKREAFLAIYLKSHLQVAEYISLESGIRF